MCLVAYSDLLPRLIHDELMKALESAPGQQADNFAEALFRVTMADGRNILEVLHREGFMKKVPTSQVIMAPTANAKIRLDELNELLAEMAKGEEAIKKMQKLDEGLGLQTKKRDNARNVGEPVKPKIPEIKPLRASETDVLTDEAIASQQMAQATRMRLEAKSLLTEADRLEGEAAAIAPRVVKTTAKKSAVAATVTESAKRGPGRPKGTSKKNDAAKETSKK